MNNWLQNATKGCCAELDKIAKRLQTTEEIYMNANDKYYQTALNTLDPNISQGKSATAFVAAVNTDINWSKCKIEGLGHGGSATNILKAAITSASQIYDERLAALAKDHQAKVPQHTLKRWHDQLIQNTLLRLGTHRQLLNSILRTGDVCILNAWSSAIKLVGTREAVELPLDDYVVETGTYATNGLRYEEVQPQVENQSTEAFYDLASSIKSLLQDWAKEIKCEYDIFQKTLRNPQYVSARDLFYYIGNKVNTTQNTNKPITITPYTTTSERKKGLLITIGGTDVTHWWDNGIMSALQIGEGAQDNAYMSAVEHAILQYLNEHPEMEGAEVTFVGYSLGGMIAQNWAAKLSSTQATDLTRNGLHVTNVVTYGSPVMGPPVEGVQYAMYVATYDPVPLLSRYENHHLSGQLPALTEELTRNPLNLVMHFGSFLATSPQLCHALLSILKTDNDSWTEKLDTYIDSHNDHEYRGKIFNITDVGSTSTLLLNFDNHQHYHTSDQLNAEITTPALPNIDPQSWGATEYFGSYAID